TNCGRSKSKLLFFDFSARPDPLPGAGVARASPALIGRRRLPSGSPICPEPACWGWATGGIRSWASPSSPGRGGAGGTGTARPARYASSRPPRTNGVVVPAPPGGGSSVEVDDLAVVAPGEPPDRRRVTALVNEPDRAVTEPEEGPARVPAAERLRRR